MGESEVVLATGDVFVTDPLVRDRLALAAHLVDMEGCAVAFAGPRPSGCRCGWSSTSATPRTSPPWTGPAGVEASAVVLGAWLEEWLSAS